MALPKKSSYRFTNVSAFEDGKTLLGDASIFPNRPANERAVLRAEDYLYLIEGLREREWVGQRPGSITSPPAKDTVLPLLTQVRLDLEDVDVAREIRRELMSLIDNPSKKFGPSDYGGSFNYPAMMSAKVDEVFPISTAIKFNSQAEMIAAVRSCIESATSYPSSPLPITVDEMTRMYDDLRRMGRVVKGCGPASSSGKTYQVDCSIDKSTGTPTYQNDSWSTSFSGTDIPLITASIIQVANKTSRIQVAAPNYLPYEDAADGFSNCVVWVMARVSGYGPSAVYYGDGSLENSTYFIERFVCSYYANPIDFGTIKSSILKAVGFGSNYDNNLAMARVLASMNLPASTQGAATFEVDAKIMGYELLSGHMVDEKSNRASFFRAAIPPLVTYGRM